MSSFWSTSITDVDRRDTDVFLICYSIFAYFALPVLAFGDGDAAGEELAAGLGLFTGALTVAPGDGEADSEGLAVFGEVELSTGSVAHPTANTIENVVRSNIAVRLIMCMFGVFIDFLPRSSKIEERDDNYPAADW